MVRRAVAFGVFAALSTALTFYIWAQIARYEPGRDSYSLVATFDDATNLHSRDDVKLAGVPVGQVRSVKVVDGRAEVRFDVDTDVVLPGDSEVAVRWRNLIGQRELYLFPGTSDERLVDGDRVTRTRSVVDLGELLNRLGPLTGSISIDQLNALVEALLGALDGNRTGVEAIIEDLGAVVGTLAAREGTIRQLLADYQTLTGALARRDEQIETVLDNLATISTTFAESEQVLDDALVHLPRLASGLQTLLAANADEVGRIIANLALVTDSVHNRLGELDTVLGELPAGLATVFGSASLGHFLLVNAVCIAPNPPPCPHPILLTAQSEGAGGLSGVASFTEALLGTPGP